MLSASIVITTKNRKDELNHALRSCFNQTAQSEVLVLDDGSTDGTEEMVRVEYPNAELIANSQSRGLIVRRNQGATHVHGDVIVSIDDDAILASPHTVAQTLAEFDNPCVGAVAMPYIEPNKENQLKQNAPDLLTTWVTDKFIGTAHAIRRDVFLQLSGYREHLVHQGEESDLCLRMLDLGYHVRLGSADPILHNESPKRDLQRMDYYGCRNSVLFLWQNCPMPFMPMQMVACILNCLRWTANPHRLTVRLNGLLAGVRECGVYSRRPVCREKYVYWRSLRTPQRLKTNVN